RLERDLLADRRLVQPVQRARGRRLRARVRAVRRPPPHESRGGGVPDPGGDEPRGSAPELLHRGLAVRPPAAREAPPVRAHVRPVVEGGVAALHPRRGSAMTPRTVFERIAGWITGAPGRPGGSRGAGWDWERAAERALVS